MNRLRMLLITTAILMGSSALASAQEFHQNGRSVQVRYDHDRDDRFRRVVYADHRWLDANRRLCYDPAFWRFDVRLGCWVHR